MKTRPKGALEIVEEAFHLLRLAPLNVLATYYVGSLPFVLGLLYFWSDMSQSAFAEDRCAMSALGVACLYLWMKGWQSAFGRQLGAQWVGDAERRWPVGQRVRRVIGQALVHALFLFLCSAGIQALAVPLQSLLDTLNVALGVLLVPLALVPLVPACAVHAFLQNVTVLGDDPTEDLGGLIRRAWQQTALWPTQNLQGFLVFLTLRGVVFINVAISMGLAPFLLKGLGVETPLSRAPETMLSSTSLAVAWGLTYLCVDPWIKAFYATRCFYGKSLKSGEDLRAELRRLLSVSVPMIGCALALGGLCQTSRAQEAPPSQTQRAVSPQDLDRAMDEIVELPEFTWKMPREKPEKTQRPKTWMGGVLDKWIEEIGVTSIRWQRAFDRFWDQIGEAWERLFPRPKPKIGSIKPGRPALDSTAVIQTLLMVLLAVLCSILAVLLLRMRRRAKTPQIEAVPVVGAPDLRDEDVGADALPTDQWLRLTEELIRQGDFRLALRALYLASLAHLADQNLIVIARFKSNRDYVLEVGRRGHALPDLMHAFSRNVTLFDRSWYGMAEVTEGMVAEFRANWERMRTFAA